MVGRAVARARGVRVVCFSAPRGLRVVCPSFFHRCVAAASSGGRGTEWQPGRGWERGFAVPGLTGEYEAITLGAAVLVAALYIGNYSAIAALVLLAKSTSAAIAE